MYFSDVAGQNDTKKTLINSIKNKNVSHCYIFEGPKNMGKYQLALVFAQSLLCTDFNDGPCNSCNNCKKVNSMNHPDLHIILNEEKIIKREDIDILIESINKKPYEANKKIYIINDCHDMTPQAANTFLKTLEEPPDDSVLILLTNNTNLLLPTIVSRCQVMKFRDVKKEEIEKILINDYHFDYQKSSMVAFYSKGILNKAINIAEGNDNILQRRKEIIELFDKIIRSDSEIIFELENYFEEQKDDIDVILEIMMLWIRDVFFVKNGIGDLVINKDFIDLAQIHAKSFSTSDVHKLIKYLQSVSDNIKNNVNYKLIIDKMLLEIQEAMKL